MRLKQTILERFSGDFAAFYGKYVVLPETNNGSVKVLSPLRRESDPSFQIQLDGPYAGRWYDFGLGEGGDLFDFTAKLHRLDITSQFPEILDRIAEDFSLMSNGDEAVPIGSGSITDEYDYRDERGVLLYQSVRIEPGQNGRSKTYRFRRPNAHKGWVWDLKNVRRVLYRLPEVLEDPDAPVVIVEGEKCVDALLQMGIVATTNPGGAGKWRPEFSEWLEGRDVVVWPDRDLAGEKHARVVSMALHGKASQVRVLDPPSDLPPKGDVWDGVATLGWTETRVRSILGQAQPWKPDDSSMAEATTREEMRSGPKKSQATRMVELTVERADLFHDQMNTPCARVYIEDHHETLRCRSSSFRQWLSRLLFDTEHKAPGSQAISSALNVLEAIACFDGPHQRLSTRVARHDRSLYYDLTDPMWRAIETNQDGWSVMPDPPALFTRYGHEATQVEPLRGGDIEELERYIAVLDEADWLLLLVYIVSCFVPDIPHPIVVLHGPQGSGKSSCFRALRRLIDPSEIEVLDFPRNRQELIQNLSHHWAPLFDNVSKLPEWQSDALCRAATGGGFSKRQLFTDDDDVIYHFRRCVGLNGINVAATKADLLDRSILVGLDRISEYKRRTEEDLWSAFEEARPRILGGIFDVLSRAVGILPEVRQATLPRMADYGWWGCAIAEALGRSADDFLDAYQANSRAQNQEVLDGQPVAAAVLAFMQDRPTGWEDTAGELLRKLTEVATRDRIIISERDRSWPKAGNALSRRLREVQPNLLEAGIDVSFRHSGGRTIVLTHTFASTVQTDQPTGTLQESNGPEGDSLDGLHATGDKDCQSPSSRKPRSVAGMDDVDGMDDPSGRGGDEDLQMVKI